MRMSSKDIRKTFIEYFVSKGHTFIESASLIPSDESLLWNNAGVTPLKKYFDGSEIPVNRRLTNYQKSLRTTDVEIVGDDTHLTFFEMLGNFSIGDYFKDEALEMSLELLTSKEYFNFNINDLYFTVHPDDIDAYNKWLSLGIPKDKIIKLEGNYWEIGEGPCGPNSEIFFDRGSEFDKDNLGLKLLEEEIDNDRYVEIWNNVFSQYNSKEGLSRNEYPELPSKNIDTGMGLERMAMVLQNKRSPYETDLFMPIINKIELLSDKKYNYDKEFRIIADHIRAITFAVADGAYFSNEGRGYVIRRLLRRATVQGIKLGINEPFLNKIVEDVINTLNHVYIYLNNKKQYIIDNILKEELLFNKTLQHGMKLLDQIKNTTKTIKIDSNDVFKLFDTYGFPFELTKEILEENGFEVSKEEFDILMEQQKERSKVNRNITANMNEQNIELMEFKKESIFVGYSTYEINSKVIGIFKDNKFVNNTDGECYLIFDKTPFYAEKGGQVSDIGQLILNNKTFNIEDVILSPNSQHMHFINLENNNINIDDFVTLKINMEYRNSIEKNHSATHLLHKALKDILDNNIFQSGSKVDHNNLRFDFTYTGKINDMDILNIENRVNEYINNNINVHIEETTLEKAKERNAVSLFNEKYDNDKVRVIEIGDSLELCGGTHVNNSKDINKFVIKSFENKGANIYRIEATTDKHIKKELEQRLETYNIELNKLLNKANNIIEEANKENINIKLSTDINIKLKYSYEDIISIKELITKVKSDINNLEKEYIKLKSQKELENISVLKNQIVTTNNINYLITKVYNYDLNILKQLIDTILNSIDNGFIFIANIKDNNVNYISKCDKNINIHCGDIIKDISQKSNGNGGGSSFFGQGGGTNINNIDQHLDYIKNIIHK